MNRQGARNARIGEPSPELDALVRRVLKAAVEVHRVLGPGFLESVYESALCAELSASSIPFVRQEPIRLEYKGRLVGEGRIDLLVGGSLIIELKAVDHLLPIHFAQVISYLKATRRHLGLLVNF
jgi:GxxExxY protein